jgi:hypothetical protein
MVVFKNVCHFSKIVKTRMAHGNSIRFSISSKTFQKGKKLNGKGRVLI